MKDQDFTKEDIKKRTDGKIRQLYNPEPEEPIKLNTTLPAPNPFPTEALGEDLGILVTEFNRIIKSPIAVCAQSVLSTISLSAQPHIDIEINGRFFPISLFIFTIAKSGERKSAVDKVALKPIDEYEEEKQSTYTKDLERYENQKIENLSLKRSERVNLNSSKPQQQTIIITEPTFEGMITLYKEGQPSMGIFSDEGGRFIHGHGMNDDNKIKTSTGISSLWDGKYISNVRVGTGNIKLYGRRLSFHLMIQPKIALSVLSDNALLDQGFLGRCLLSWPASMMGSRSYIDENIFKNDAYIKYDNKIKFLLNHQKRFKENDLTSLNPRRISLSKQAFKLFLEFYNEVENELRIGGQYHDISSFANKALEHACRIAGCLTIYNDINATEISAYYMINAITIMRYYLAETQRLFCNPELNLVQASQREISNHAQELLDWLTKKHAEQDSDLFNGNIISHRSIRNYAPSKYRDKNTCSFLISQLVDSGWLIPNETRKTYTLVIIQ